MRGKYLSFYEGCEESIRAYSENTRKYKAYMENRIQSYSENTRKESVRTWRDAKTEHISVNNSPTKKCLDRYFLYKDGFD
jgi:hypothetical protein